MPAPTENSSPAEPRLLSAVLATDLPDSARRSSTGPSPVMPSLSPYPLAGGSCSDRVDCEVQCPPLHCYLDKIPDRRTLAKKMLDFGDTPLMQGDDEVRHMEDGEQSLESVVDREALSPSVAEEDTALESNHPELSPFGSPHVEDADTGHEHTDTGHEHADFGHEHADTGHDEHADTGNEHADIGHEHADTGHEHADTGHEHADTGHELDNTTPSPRKTSKRKRPRSISPGENNSKRPCQTPLNSGDSAPLVVSPKTPDKLAADPETSVLQSRPTSPPKFTRPSGVDTPTLDAPERTELGEAGDPEDVLRCYGINLFSNSDHRQELISFCEQSLVQTNEYCTYLNNNNNNDESDGHYRNHTAHDKLESMVQRARARGFQVSDAVYFDGKQYVPIKVAANGQGKFRLLLPPDHPHRRGVAEEIPIFTTFDFDCSQEDMSQVEDDDVNELLQESNL